MKKEVILEKSRRDSSYLDEKEQRELSSGFGFGGIVVAILCVIFSMIKVFQQESFYEFGVILFGYISSTSLYSYARTKKKHFLIQGIAGAIALAGGLVGCFSL